MTGNPVRPEPDAVEGGLAPVRIGRFILRAPGPLVMGIVNLTPDSFYDGGRSLDPGKTISHAKRLIDEGADIVDIGAESTRPGADPVDVRVELERLRPLLAALRDSPVPVSVDTMKPEVMRIAIGEGAAMINDVYALRAPGALEAVAGTDASVCLMHMQGEPRTMQTSPFYEDVVSEVRGFLAERADAVVASGLSRERIFVDPGFGFGKTVDHNMRLLACLESFRQLGYPVLFGASRKSSLGTITGREPDDRLAASLAVALMAAERGAAVLRVHDVTETRDVLKVLASLRKVAEG